MKTIDQMASHELDAYLSGKASQGVLDQLTEGERYDYQTRRYGYSFCTVAYLKTGRILVLNPFREPVAIIRNLQELQLVLEAGRRIAKEWEAQSTSRRVKLDTAVKQQKKDDDGLSSIEINL